MAVTGIERNFLEFPEAPPISTSIKEISALICTQDATILGTIISFSSNDFTGRNFLRPSGIKSQNG